MSKALCVACTVSFGGKDIGARGGEEKGSPLFL